MSLLFGLDAFPLRSVLRDMEDLFGDGVKLPGWALSRRGYPPVNVTETPDSVVVEFELPGTPLANTELTVTAGSLTLKAKRPVEGDIPPEKYYVRERWRGEFGRTVTIPGTVDTAAARAAYKNGVLKVVIPKKEEVRPRKIDVKTS